MSFGLGKRGLTGLAVVMAGALLWGTVGQARAADIFEASGASVDQAGAVLIFPKVMYRPVKRDGTVDPRDTIIQITNVFNSTALVRCFYMDGSIDPNTQRQECRVTDFQLVLTKQQPTHWVASMGRAIDPSDGLGNPDSGFDPGLIPPVRDGFEGELRCVVVDQSENPLPNANWLKGTATLRHASGDVSNYSAIALKAGDLAGIDGNVLVLDQIGKDTTSQYSSCPDALLMNFLAYGGDSPVASQDPLACPVAGDCPIETSITLIPCSTDYESLIFGEVSVLFEITNEFENTLSAATTLGCWLDTPLDRIGGGGAPVPNNPFTIGVLGSESGLARILPVDGEGGVLGLAEETHNHGIINDGVGFARAIFNLQHEGSQALGQPFESLDRIVLSGP